MSTDKQDQAAVQTRLWDHLEKHDTGMLGLVGGAPQHFQPMTAFLERADNRIWFYTYKDSDLAEAVTGGQQAMFVIQQDRKLWACIGGRLSQHHDPERIERYWNANVAAWYPEGKDDPRLTLICLEASDAEVWFADKGLMNYAFEIAKANTTKTTPDIGGHAHVNFH